MPPTLALQIFGGELDCSSGVKPEIASSYKGGLRTPFFSISCDLTIQCWVNLVLVIRRPFHRTSLSSKACDIVLIPCWTPSCKASNTYLKFRKSVSLSSACFEGSFGLQASLRDVKLFVLYPFLSLKYRLTYSDIYFLN